MKFTYLIQTEGELPSIFKDLLNRPNVSLLHLTFRHHIEGAIFLPNSTWTEGRNALLSRARQIGLDSDYYIFSDDDIIFQSGSWLEFEESLERWLPPVATPQLTGYHGQPNIEQIVSVYDFDAILNAFHRDVIEDGVVLPYLERFDSITWWLSQLFVIHLCGILYQNYVLKIPYVSIMNGQSRPYPRNGEIFDAATEWFRSAAISDPATAALVRADIKDGTQEQSRAALPPLPSWFLTDATRALIRPDWKTRPAPALDLLLL